MLESSGNCILGRTPTRSAAAERYTHTENSPVREHIYNHNFLILNLIISTRNITPELTTGILGKLHLLFLRPELTFHPTL